MNKILFFTNLPSHYRKAIWLKILENENYNFHFYFGSGKTGIKEIDFNQPEIFLFKNRLNRIRNIWFVKKIIIWQTGVISKCLKCKYDSVFFMGDMFVISTWIAALICRLRNKEVIFWGHGIYGNESFIKLRIRLLFLKISNKNIVYNKRGKYLLLKHGFNPNNIYIIFNSLDYDNQLIFRKKYNSINKKVLQDIFKNYNLPLIVFIGRLTPEKKINLLLESFKRINKNISICNLLIIGDGEIKEKLMLSVKDEISTGNIFFAGSIYNEDQIAKYLSLSDLCISPGNVGLTAIHSLNYGTPVCTHDNFDRQMPEVESIISGKNGFFFKEDDVFDLTNKIFHFINNYNSKNIIQPICYDIIDQYYNPNYQLNVIISLLEGESPKL